MLVSAPDLELCLDVGLFLNTRLARLIAQALCLPPAAFCSTTMSARSLPTALRFIVTLRCLPSHVTGGSWRLWTCRNKDQGWRGYTHSLLSHTLLTPKAFGPWSSEPVQVKSGSRSLHFPFHRCRAVSGEQCRFNEPMSFLQRLCYGRRCLCTP